MSDFCNLPLTGPFEAHHIFVLDSHGQPVCNCSGWNRRSPAEGRVIAERIAAGLNLLDAQPPAEPVLAGPSLPPPPPPRQPGDKVAGAYQSGSGV